LKQASLRRRSIDGVEVDELLQHADVAMYMAKSKHLGSCGTTPTTTTTTRRSWNSSRNPSRNRRRPARAAYNEESLLDGRVEAIEALVALATSATRFALPRQFPSACRADGLLDKLTDWSCPSARRHQHCA